MEKAIIFLLVTTFTIELHAASQNTGSLKVFQHADQGGQSQVYTESEFSLEDFSGNPYKGTRLALPLYNGGTVCYHYFKDNDNANTICKEMGYKHATQWRRARFDYWTHNQRNYPIKLRIRCPPGSSFSECTQESLTYHDNLPHCDHKDDVILSCGNGERTISEGNMDAIICSQGSVLNIEGAMYGSKSGSCSVSNALNEVKFQCHGKRACYLHVNENVFGNSCESYGKHLEVNFQCVWETQIKRESNVKEGKNINLSCEDQPGKTIIIDWATYRRAFWRDGCDFSDDAVSKMELSCNNKESCEVKASNDNFGDTCRGYTKDLVVTYRCV